MARLLASQRHVERALTIHEELMAHNGAAAELAGEAMALRNGQPVGSELPPLRPDAELAAHVPAHLPAAADRIVCHGGDGEAVCLRGA